MRSVPAEARRARGGTVARARSSRRATWASPRMKSLVLHRVSSPILSAIRTPAVAATDNGLLAPEPAAGIARVKSAKSMGVRSGKWLPLRQAQALLNAPDIPTTEGLRDRAIIAVLLGCALRRSEVAALTMGLHTAEGWPVVHCRFVREARARADHTHAGLGQGSNRCLDRPRRRGGRIRVPARQPRRPGAGRRAVREGRVANAPALRQGCWGAGYCAPRRTALLREILPSSRGRT